MIIKIYNQILHQNWSFYKKIFTRFYTLWSAFNEKKKYAHCKNSCIKAQFHSFPLSCTTRHDIIWATRRVFLEKQRTHTIAVHLVRTPSF